MALPGFHNYHRYGISHLDLPQPINYYPDQNIIPAPRGSRHLATPTSAQPAVYATQPLLNQAHSAYPPIHVHAGPTFNATVHMNIYPNNNNNNNDDDGHHHPVVFPRIDDSSSHHYYNTVTVDSPDQQTCGHCDHRFSHPYLLTSHKNRNSLHCACCRECFASWPDYYARVGGCISRGGGGGYDDDRREHYWLDHDHHHRHREGGRVLGEVRDLELRGGGGFHEDEAFYYGPEGWVFEERHGRSRTRRRRGRSRGRYGATTMWRSCFI